MNGNFANAAATAFWNTPTEQLFGELDSFHFRITQSNATARLVSYGPNVTRDERGTGTAALLRKQFASPLVLILSFGALVSLALEDTTDSIIIIAIV